MIENNEKGWFGSYSIAGRNSAGQYHTIVQKNEILSQEKKIVTKDFFAPDDSAKYQFLEPDIDVYQKYELNSDELVNNYEAKQLHKQKKKKKKKTEGRNKPNKDSYSQQSNNNIECTKSDKKKSNNTNENSKYKYHNRTELKLHRIRKYTKDPKDYRSSYNPKMECIWAKTITGPEWSKSKGKRKTIFELEAIDTKDYYQSGMPNTLSPRSLVNMNLQTQRGFFGGNNDVRYRSDKKFHPFTSEDNINSLSKTDRNQSCSITSNAIYKSKTSSHLNSVIQKSKLKESNTNNMLLTKSTMFSSPNILLAKGVNFKKTMSREQVDRAKDIGRFSEKLDSLDPSYAYVRDRAITMVIYDQHKKKIDKRDNLREKIKVDPSFFYDATETYNKIKINSGANAPKFALMSSRPINSDPLPSYMKKLFNRAAINMTTEKTLKLNNYSEGQFLQQFTSFKQKKSFNYAFQNKANLQRMIGQNRSLTSLLIYKLSE